MNKSQRHHHRSDLVRIAIEALAERGLEPEFPAAVERQLQGINGPGRDDDARIQDLRARPWCSIDNDDSRDLDQLSVCEPLPGGDMVREWGPFAGDTSVYYLSGNRNKKSVALNFRSSEGARILREMAAKVDVVVENFRPGVMEQMGMSLAELHALNPALILASITGFGSHGPKSSWPGFDQVAQGFAGFMSFTGSPESGPQRVGVAIGDLTSGMWAAVGVLGAVIQGSI